MRTTSLVFPLRFLFFMWVVFSIEFFLRVDLGYLGIYPRDFIGLIGVVTAPLLHGSIAHILSNSVPLLVLGGILFYFFPFIALRVFFHCYLITNILVWIFGRPFFHIGASGLVYGLAFFLISFGFFRRNLKSILISIIVIIFYGGMVYSAFHIDYRISWESHLFGALTGLVTAFTLRNYEVKEDA